MGRRIHALMVCENAGCGTNAWTVRVEDFHGNGGPPRCPDCRRRGRIWWTGSWLRLLSPMLR